MGIIYKSNEGARTELCSAILEFKEGGISLERARKKVFGALKKLPLNHKKAFQSFSKLLEAGNSNRALKLAGAIDSRSYRSWVYVAGSALFLFGIYAELFL